MPVKTVAVVTATTGRPSLLQAVTSVRDQTYPCTHYVIFDGRDDHGWYTEISGYENVRTLMLPKPTGLNGVMNGAICAAASYLTTEDYICYLDDDNWFEPTHVESLMSVIADNAYAYSLRKLVEPDGTFWANDDGESLGHIGEMSDSNCLMLQRSLAQGIAPLCMSSTPDGGSTWDRAVWNALQHHKIKWAASGKYTVNYRINSRRSLKGWFFLRNIQMRAHYPDGFPWASAA